MYSLIMLLIGICMSYTFHRVSDSSRIKSLSENAGVYEYWLSMIRIAARKTKALALEIVFS